MLSVSSMAIPENIRITFTERLLQEAFEPLCRSLFFVI